MHYAVCTAMRKIVFVGGIKQTHLLNGLDMLSVIALVSVVRLA